MKPRNLRRSLVDWEIVEGCVMACFLGALLLLPFAARMYAPELLALLGR